jgi:streptomycin 6-kinase
VTIDQIARYLELWQLAPDGEPFETNASWLSYVRSAGAPAVLKIPKLDSEERLNAAALEHYGDGAAVRVLKRDAQAFLMERAVPGTELKALSLEGRDDEATHIICDLIEKLHTRPAPPGEWKKLEQLALGFDRYRKGARRHPLLMPDLVNRAEATFLELCASQSERFLLHGDLHHMNILSGGSRGWLMIDPKGVIGELAYETASVLHNPIPHFDMIADPKFMERRVRILSDRLRLDPTRILQWCFAKDILGHLWTIEDNHDASDFPRSLRVAETAALLLGRGQLTISTKRLAP